MIDPASHATLWSLGIVWYKGECQETDRRWKHAQMTQKKKPILGSNDHFPRKMIQGPSSTFRTCLEVRTVRFLFLNISWNARPIMDFSFGDFENVFNISFFGKAPSKLICAEAIPSMSGAYSIRPNTDRGKEIRIKRSRSYYSNRYIKYSLTAM